MFRYILIFLSLVIFFITINNAQILLSFGERKTGDEKLHTETQATELSPNYRSHELTIDWKDLNAEYSQVDFDVSYVSFIIFT